MSVICLDQWRKKREKSWESESQSQLNSRLLKLGQDLTDLDYNTQQLIATYATLDLALKKPFKLQCRFARENSMYVAICASQGWTTNCIGEDAWGDRWGITSEGMETLENIGGFLSFLLNRESTHEDNDE